MSLWLFLCPKTDAHRSVVKFKQGQEVRDHGNIIWLQAETCLERFFGQ
nr:MAG TPA: hypothetical protein [Caudoviricetes sp.]